MQTIVSMENQGFRIRIPLLGRMAEQPSCIATAAKYRNYGLAHVLNAKVHKFFS